MNDTNDSLAAQADSSLSILPATRLQMFKHAFQRYTSIVHWYHCLKNTIALRRKADIYNFIKNDSCVILCLPTVVGEYCIITHPAYIREILKYPRLAQGEFFGEGRQLRVIAEALGRFRMSQERGDAKEKRNILAQLLSNSERYIPKMQEVSLELITKWLHKQDSIFYINNDIQEFTVAIYLKTVMNFTSEVSKIPNILEQQIDLLAKRLIYKKTKKFHSNFKKLRNELVKIVGQDDGLLATTEYTDKLSKYIEKQHQLIRDDAFATGLNGAMLAGYLAPYPAFLALIYELGINPMYQEKLWSERKQLNLDFIEYIKKEDTLLNACVHEVLRLHPSQPFVFRSTTQALILNGQYVRKNAEIIANIYHVLRDPSLWGEQADMFYPERFMEEPTRYRFPFLVYSSGPNNCTGQIFSRFCLKVLLAELVTKIRWQVVNVPIKHHFYFALTMDKDIKINVRENQYAN